MKYIKEALLIIKTRWPEAAILIVLPVALTVFGSNSQGIATLLLLISFIFISILYLGFLRTVFASKDQLQTPITLLKEGKSFFWRFVYVAFLYAAIFIAITIIPATLLMYFSHYAVDLKDTNSVENFMAFENNIHTIVLTAEILTSVLFIKFLLFLPAVIIATDVTVPLGLGLIKNCQLKDVKAIVVLFLIPVAISSIWLFVPSGYRFVLKSLGILSIFSGIINQSIALVVNVAMIRFVASLDLLYDNENDSEPDLTEGEN